MTRLIFVKLGGSLITDKKVAGSYHESAVAAVGAILREALERDPSLRLLVGHGSGSFGHVAAKKYGTIDSVKTPDQWRGLAHVASAAADLNYLVRATLRAADLPVWCFQPSASALSHDGEITSMSVEAIRAALDHALVPLVYGDVSLDDVRGGTIISTETIFFYLAKHLRVEQILLLGDVEGVYDETGAIIPVITPGRFGEIQGVLGGSAGTDVTGGMAAKVRQMLDLVTALPSLSIRIMGGDSDAIAETLRGEGEETHGTLIRAD